MAIQQSELSEVQTRFRFIAAVIDDCVQSERAILEMSEIGPQLRNVQMFYAHQTDAHSDSTGQPIGRLQVVFQYLEDLLGLDNSTSREYEAHLKAGRHVLLANVYSSDDARNVSSILGRAQSHTGRVLGYGHTSRPMAFAT